MGHLLKNIFLIMIDIFRTNIKDKKARTFALLTKTRAITLQCQQVSLDLRLDINSFIHLFLGL